MIIVPKPGGDAGAVREAIRTGDWSAVSERDLMAWREAPIAGNEITLTPEQSEAFERELAETPLKLEPGTVEELPSGTSMKFLSGSAFLAAIHGVDGMENPHLSDLSWLRDLLRRARNAGAIQALQ